MTTLLATDNATTIAKAIQRSNSIDTLSMPVEAMHWRDAMDQAQLDWTVSKIQHRSPLTNELVDSYGIYRNDNQAFLGQVGNQYTAIQNVDQFQFVDQLVESIDGAHYVAAGAVEGGQKVFCVAKIGSFAIGNSADEHNAFLIVHDFKNSRGACKAQISILRKVCENGMHAWMPEAAMKFRHTPKVQTRMDLVSGSVNSIAATVDSVREKLQLLASRQINSQQTVTNILDRLFPPTAAELSGRANNSRVEVQAKVLELFEDNDGNAFANEASTPFALLNAVTQYTDHFQTTRSTTARRSMDEVERRANNALFGRGAEFKANALDIILDETRLLPSNTTMALS